MADTVDNDIFEVNKQKFKMLVTIYDDSASVLGLQQQQKRNETVLATSNVLEFQYVNQLGKLCLEGTLKYVDTEGFVANFIGDEYVGLDIYIAKQKQESDGTFTREENDVDNQFEHNFIVNNIEIIGRSTTSVVYLFHLTSKQWYNFSAKLDISTYSKDSTELSGGVVGLVKECLVHNKTTDADDKLFTVDNTFDICKDSIKLDYISKANDNVFTAIDYLMNKQFYYQTIADSMKFIAFNESSRTYKIIDLANKDTFGKVQLIFLSMFKTQEEQMAYSQECNIGTVVRFPKMQLHQALFAKQMSTYDFLNNNIQQYEFTRQNIARTFNNAGDDSSSFLSKLNEELLGQNTTSNSSLITTNYGAIWQNDFNQYTDFYNELLGDNALMIDVDGIIGKFPGDTVVFSIEEDQEVGDASIANGNEATYLNLKRRYERLKKGTWIVGKIRHIISPANKQFRQFVVAFQNYLPQLSV